MERIINFFPEERRNQLLMDLSANLRAIVSQRLVRTEDGKGRVAAIEILLNTPTIAEKIFKGEFTELKGVMNKSRELGMRTFDWALFELYNEGLISYDEAIRNADSANELRLHIKLKSARGEPQASAFMSLSLDQDPTPEELEEQRHQEMLKQQETRRRLEEEQLAQLREKKRLAELAAQAAKASASAASCSGSVRSAELRSRCLSRPRASGAPCAMRCAQAAVCAGSWLAGTTSLTSPQRSACAASKDSATSAMRSALRSPTTRGRPQVVAQSALAPMPG